MISSHNIMELVRNNNGFITTTMVVEAGYYRGSLKYLVDTGQLEKASRGVYTLPEVFEDEFINIQSRYKRGIFSLDTALFLCDLTDKTPCRYHMTFPYTYNLTKPKENGVLCSSAREPFYSLGVEEITSPSGNKIRAYSAERTLCDILCPKNHVDVQVIATAFRRYISRLDRNIPLLSYYAKKLKCVESKLRAYLEVLL